MNYEDVIARKSAAIAATGMAVEDGDLAAHMFPHQRDLTRWALRRGRSAMFADTGLGKGPMLLEWARHVSRLGRVLILAPLAVGQQLAREGIKFGVNARYVRADDPAQRIVIANYEMLHAFDASAFIGVALDESSILKSFDGRTKQRLIDAFRDTPYKLCCTATPAPNDFTELGNHSEFLGLKTRAEMLAEFFVHDGGSTQDWTIKGHAVVPFWRWVASWGAVVKMPSDLGHPDGAFRLPPMRMVEHVVPASHHDIAGTGQLFALQARSLQEQRAAKRATIGSRAVKIAKLLDGLSEPVIIWCELNDEADEIERSIPGAVQVSGSDDDQFKELAIEWFIGLRCLCTLADRTDSKPPPCTCGHISGRRVLISKASIFGFGLNLQVCHRVVFAGPSNSYERTYQAIRRCWRFGQEHEVTVDIVRSEIEEAVIENYRRKEADAAKMAAEMTAHVGEAVRAAVRGLAREFNDYDPRRTMATPSWLRSEQ